MSEFLKLVETPNITIEVRGEKFKMHDGPLTAKEIAEFSQKIIALVFTKKTEKELQNLIPEEDSPTPSSVAHRIQSIVHELKNVITELMSKLKDEVNDKPYYEDYGDFITSNYLALLSQIEASLSATEGIPGAIIDSIHAFRKQISLVIEQEETTRHQLLNSLEEMNAELNKLHDIFQKPDFETANLFFSKIRKLTDHLRFELKTLVQTAQNLIAEKEIELLTGQLDNPSDLRSFLDITDYNHLLYLIKQLDTCKEDFENIITRAHNVNFVDHKNPANIQFIQEIETTFAGTKAVFGQILAAMDQISQLHLAQELAHLKELNFKYKSTGNSDKLSVQPRGQKNEEGILKKVLKFIAGSSGANPREKIDQNKKENILKGLLRFFPKETEVIGHIDRNRRSYKGNGASTELFYEVFKTVVTVLGKYLDSNTGLISKLVNLSRLIGNIGRARQKIKTPLLQAQQEISEEVATILDACLSGEKIFFILNECFDIIDQVTANLGPSLNWENAEAIALKSETTEIDPSKRRGYANLEDVKLHFESQLLFAVAIMLIYPVKSQIGLETLLEQNQESYDRTDQGHLITQLTRLIAHNFKELIEHKSKGKSEKQVTITPADWTKIFNVMQILIMDDSVKACVQACKSVSSAHIEENATKNTPANINLSPEQKTTILILHTFLKHRKKMKKANKEAYDYLISLSMFFLTSTITPLFKSLFIIDKAPLDLLKKLFQKARLVGQTSSEITTENREEGCLETILGTIKDYFPPLQLFQNCQPKYSFLNQEGAWDNFTKKYDQIAMMILNVLLQQFKDGSTKPKINAFQPQVQTFFLPDSDDPENANDFCSKIITAIQENMIQYLTEEQTKYKLKTSRKKA